MALLSRCQLELRNGTCRGFVVGHSGCRCWLAAVIDGCFLCAGGMAANGRRAPARARSLRDCHEHVCVVSVGLFAPSGFPLTDTPISEVQALFSTKTFARSAGTNRPPWS